MKKIFMFSLMMVAGLMLLGGTTPVFADERDERLNRLEQCLHQVIQQQQQMIQRFGPALQRPGAPPLPGAAAMRPPLPPPGPAGVCPMPPASDRRCPLATCCPRVVLGLFLLASVINILMAVWIFTDIRKRGEGHGIFIVLALLAGIPTGIIYALVRIGDKKTS